MRFPGNVVTKEDLRSNAEKCFYCTGVLDGEHDAACVILDRPVKVRMTIDLIIARPRSWAKHDIEFHLNDSSWCIDNIKDDIERQVGDRCLCSFANFEYTGEATLEEASAAHLVPDDERHPDLPLQEVTEPEKNHGA